jgi:hypothetical protein
MRVPVDLAARDRVRRACERRDRQQYERDDND